MVGVTAHTEIDFDLDNASPAAGAVKKKCHDIRRKIEDELGAQPYEHIHAICGADFFDDLITHSEVAKAYDRYLDGAFLRQGQARGSFEYSGIVFEEYRGRVGTVGVDAVYTPAGGEPVPVRVISRRPDTIVGFSETRIPRRDGKLGSTGERGRQPAAGRSAYDRRRDLRRSGRAGAA
jgi:hypothetical protein